jgi:hypothetical protein
VVGFIAAALLSGIIMGWAGFSDFEGERAMTSAFLFGPMGGLLGLALGIWLALKFARQRRPRRLRQAGLAGGARHRRRALRQEALDVAHGLAQPLAVLDQGDAHMARVVFAEAKARRHRHHLGVGEQQL